MILSRFEYRLRRPKLVIREFPYCVEDCVVRCVRFIQKRYQTNRHKLNTCIKKRYFLLNRCEPRKRFRVIYKITRGSLQDCKSEERTVSNYRSKPLNEGRQPRTFSPRFIFPVNPESTDYSYNPGVESNRY